MSRIRTSLVIVGLLGCGAAPAPDAHSPIGQPSEGEHARTEVTARDPGIELPSFCAERPLAVRDRGSAGDRLVVDGVAMVASSIQEINVNGDDELELIVRGDCPRGTPCGFSVFAACGGGQYALLPAKGLRGDRVDTSMKGALVDGIYWRDVMAYEFQGGVGTVGETSTRFRYDGRQLDRLEE